MKSPTATFGSILILCTGLNACASIRSVIPFGKRDPFEKAAGSAPADARNGDAADDSRKAAERAARMRAEARARLKPHPRVVRASATSAEPVRRAAFNSRGLRVLVSTSERTLWLMRDTSAVFVAPVAVGMQDNFTWAGKTYDFDTPFGRRKILAKGETPVWVPPEWHYFEKAAEEKLVPVFLKRGERVPLKDGTRIEVRGDQVGRVNQYGNFWPFTAGTEIILEGRIFIPPIGTAQRRVPAVLGTHKLEIGDGYLIHGTNEDTSIGD
ncbi:MAG TPA: L,D-transpeptidase, partial [Longimicrobiales bacterium]|nr:L,D-transpeptidase [Longimicrobiales bacterium]